MKGSKKPLRMGMLPALTLLGSLGLLLIAFADNAAREQLPYAMVLFWFGILVLFVPIATRLSLDGLTRSERIGLILVLGIGLYLVKVLYSPMEFRSHDEFVQLRAVSDVVQSRHFFRENPLLPVAAFYPGLAGLASAGISLTGLDPFLFGTLVIGMAKVILTLALFFLYENVSGSARLAGIASVIYMANPNYLFFDAHFSYESLALPVAVFVLFALERRYSQGATSRLGWALAALLAVGAVTITHHMTALIMAGFLLLWTIAGSIQISKTRYPSGISILALAMIVAWWSRIAPITFLYSSYILKAGANDFFRLVAGEQAPRALFVPFAGPIASIGERLVAFSSIGIILFGLPFGLYQTWRNRRGNLLALLLCSGTLLYPLSLALRLTQNGAEISNRTSEFLFISISLVLATACLSILPTRRTSLLPILIFTTLLTVLFAGGIAVGRPAWSRLPGSYLVEADMRSIEPESVSAAQWTGAVLGPGQRMITDRTNSFLISSIGNQRLVTRYGDGLNTAHVVLNPTLGPNELATLRLGEIQYILVDQRMSTGLPVVGVYFETGEPGANMHMTPVSPAALNKFETMDRVSRIFDSGNIVIYDVRGISHAP